MMINIPIVTTADDGGTWDGTFTDVVFDKHRLLK